MININDILAVIQKNLSEEVGSIYRHENYIFVGNNMSGKSKLLRKLLDNNKDMMYFIDSNNRTIAKHNPRGLFEYIKDINDILEERLQDNNFNNNDSITNSYNNALILNELCENYKIYESIIESYFGQKFKVIPVEEISGSELFERNIVYKYIIDERTVKELSNGFQAILRILIEVIFAVSRGKNTIVIEEIDLHLDTENCRKIIKFLQNNFKVVKWIFTTHSPEIILNADEFNVIKILEDNCTYFDGEDMTSIPYINRMLFEPCILTESYIDVELSNFLRLISMGECIIEKDINKIKSYQNLTVKQEVLRKYILEWNDED